MVEEDGVNAGSRRRRRWWWRPTFINESIIKKEVVEEEEEEEGVTAMEAGRLREAEVTTAGAGLWGIMEQELPLREDTKPRPGLPPQ